jgi:hypothetical protein
VRGLQTEDRPAVVVTIELQPRLLDDDVVQAARPLLGEDLNGRRVRQPGTRPRDIFGEKLGRVVLAGADDSSLSVRRVGFRRVVLRNR